MGEPMIDLRAEFAKLCAEMPAGDAGETAYEETLGLAVLRLVRRTRGHHAGFSRQQLPEVAPPTMDCPFMMSVTALSLEHPTRSSH
jgi:hypothetical protein